MHGPGYQNSALHNANIDTHRKESNDVWLAQEELRVRTGHDVWVCVEGQENSEKTEVEACLRVRDLGRYRGGKFRSIIMNCQNWSTAWPKMPTNTRIEGRC